MLPSVLNSDRAIQVNIQIMRTFIKLRNILAEHRELMLSRNFSAEKYKDLLKKLEAMEKNYNFFFEEISAASYA